MLYTIQYLLEGPLSFNKLIILNYIITIWEQFIRDLQQASSLELLAAVAGIISVWFSKRESIWVYPIGLVNTIIYIYISFQFHLLGEALVNFYYSVMGIYGWILWSKRDKVSQQQILYISFSSKKEWLQQIGFFTTLFCCLWVGLNYFKSNFFEGVIPAADAFATATAFTGMWLMTRKKVESWYWWIATNITSIPLYFSKHLVVTSIQYLLLLALAIAGLISWFKKATNKQHASN
jgi:nicotinamide mononucleotide transporter